ncbi:MAG: hypothetical protein AB8B69_06890 [Chitinophagales bacterium]
MKNIFQILGIAAIFLAFLTPQLSYGQVKIGDTHEGGIVFSLDGNGGGLICAESDQSDGANLDDAVKICEDLAFNGYDDWYLPSMTEMRKMNAELFERLNFSLQEPGKSPAFYWTADKVALTLYTKYDGYGFDGKSAEKLIRVRAIRAF